MDFAKIQAILVIVGAVALGLPALLRALEAFFALIPGEQPDKALAAVRGFSEKVADVIGKILPSKPDVPKV